MKKLIIIPFLILSIGALAQKIKIKSVAGDSIYVYSLGAFQLSPFPINMASDTVRSGIWTLQGIERNPKFTGGYLVTLFDRNANPIGQRLVPITPIIVAAFTTLSNQVDINMHNTLPKLTIIP